ncbi:uncharacterized protein DUF202 [Isoptericola sp. CG 20/1183]|uniref:Uncharacterized protein DUF202 n=1 Tax=Isoptericola halotolerans TaxID=300560 RepID=A0ABX5ED42_9MICO|nr:MULTISPECIES: DUF202 domain-containing protein [Isoptericola]MCK0117148.1 DUF202 domain-containing protein [Isoptericola sp. S6320L]PRZ05749.1 uncharacterized protein DUF202 [Isoptericola halotolerans]PRZ06317.1 uncharacterized protein DUF202 [Isoptericola sp. CG 20/1183]
MSDPAQAPDRGERGLAAERTALAWRRTLLSFIAACLVAIQVFPTVQGSRALALAAGIALALTPPMWWFAAQHARHTGARLQEETPRLRHGRRIALICAGTGLLGAGGVVLVLVF